jgi:3-oxoacyl-[acyl-carrier protein] reductase
MALLRGKVALITGASRGIGRGIALRFAKEEAKVGLVFHQRQKEAEETGRIIRERGGECIVLQGDVSLINDVDRFVSHTLEIFGRIDILVNNAGIGGSKACLDTPEAEWVRMLDVNLKPVFLVSKRVLPGMIKQGKGKIINIASKYGMFGSPGVAGYCASKAGIINFTRQMAVDYAPKNVNVNVISPGLIDTEMTEKKIKNPKVLSRALQSIPLNRYGRPEDIAGAALFLASDDSDFVTGQNLAVDGGETCRMP